VATEEQRQRQKLDDDSPPSNGARSRGPRSPFLGDQTGLKEAVARETSAAFDALERNAKLNFYVRASLYLTGWLAVVLAGWYTVHHGDQIVDTLRRTDHLHAGRVVGLTLPAILLVLLAAACIGAALMIQTRGIDDFEEGLAGVTRLRREVDVGVSRSRTSVHALEEFLGNAKRAFNLQLWLCRTLFVVCLVLFGLAVANGIVSGVDWATAALGAGSILTLLLGTASGLPRKVGLHLADATQVQTIVVSATRRINVLEEQLYKLIEAHRQQPEVITGALRAGTKEIGKVAHEAVAEIQRYAEPPNESDKQDRPRRDRDES
jgi:hypothetical protein